MTKSVQSESQNATSHTVSNASGSTESRFVVRLPSGLLKQIKRLSRRNKRSMNAEIVLLLQSHLSEQGLLDDAPLAILKRKLSVLDESKATALLKLLD